MSVLMVILRGEDIRGKADTTIVGPINVHQNAFPSAVTQSLQFNLAVIQSVKALLCHVVASLNRAKYNLKY